MKPLHLVVASAAALGAMLMPAEAVSQSDPYHYSDWAAVAVYIDGTNYAVYRSNSQPGRCSWGSAGVPPSASQTWMRAALWCRSEGGSGAWSLSAWTRNASIRAVCPPERPLASLSTMCQVASIQYQSFTESDVSG